MKRGLGRGLEALLAVYDKDKNSENTEKESVTKIYTKPENSVDEYIKAQGEISEIPINEVYPNPNQPRKNFDRQSLEELCNSIKVHGLIQPITVNKTDKGYMIIAGERRWKACKMAGYKKISAVVKFYTERQIAEISIIENLQREDLNPVEIAKGVKKLMVEFSSTQEEVADRIGKSRSAVANYLRILNLYPEVVEMIEKNKISFGHAKCLVGVIDYTTQLLLAKKVAQDKLTVRDLENSILELSGSKQSKKAKPSVTFEMREFLDRMQKTLGTKVSCIGNEKKGRIYIDYYSTDDLDRLYNFFLE